MNVTRDDDRRCKLTADLVRKARRLRAQGESIPTLAKRFGVGNATMRRALIGENWSYVQEIQHE